MVRDRHDPPLPNVSWEVGITRLPLGTPVIRLIVQGTKVDLPVGDAVRLGTALSNAAMTFPAEVSRSLADDAGDDRPSWFEDRVRSIRAGARRAGARFKL